MVVQQVLSNFCEICEGSVINMLTNFKKGIDIATSLPDPKGPLLDWVCYTFRLSIHCGGKQRAIATNSILSGTKTFIMVWYSSKIHDIVLLL